MKVIAGSGLAFSFRLFVLFTVFSQFNALYAQRRIPGDFYPGDAVKVIVWQDPTAASIADLNIDRLGISNDYIIDRKGYILLPLIGEVRVIGRSSAALADTLTSRYRAFVSGLYFVCKPLIRLTILGAVNHPGSYLVERTASLWQAINQAGGPTPGADLRKIYLTRSGRKVAKNLLQVYEKAYTLTEVGVRSGDQLVIPLMKSFNMRDVLDYGSFIISVLVLYLQIQRASK
ncbi:MAG: hypothetical protein D6814_00475 [Calditrichaeota bacterium]|nr:MAG: hypothetical protein D6814_00475 [Calditrichota bacterium]